MDIKAAPEATTAPADVFISHELRSNPDRLYRARVLVLILLLQLAVHIILLLGAIFSPLLAEARGVTASLSLGSVAAILYSLYLLKAHSNYNACCLVAIAQSFIALVSALAITGGPNDSYVGQLLGIPCLMAFFFGGQRWGVASIVITITTLTAMIVLQMLEVPFPQMTTDAFRPYAPAVVLIINFALVTTMSLIYELTHFSIKKERDYQHEKFARLARIDPLTGLANRRVFDEIFAEKIALYSKLVPVRSFALCYLDLDKFKPINDQFGHDVGDEVLNAISTRLRSALRGADFICRHGGDEFMMLLDTVQNAHAAAALAKRFLLLVEEPIETAAGTMQVGGSFGFSLFPLHGTDMPALQKAADAAMYEAKRTHCGFVIFSSQPT